VVFDESVFPYSTTSPPPTTSELDLFSSFPTNIVDQPPLVFPAGTTPPGLGPAPCIGPAAPASGDAPAPAPCVGPEPSTSAPAARFAQPVRIYQRRERPTLLHPEPVPSAPAACFAQPVHVYQRREQPAPLHPESVPPPPPSSPPPGDSSPPSTPTP
jgi:hypothetical protein